MRRRRAAGAMAAPPGGGVRLVSGLPRMGVDFASEGLLDGLHGEARTARLELLERLHAEGATIDELRAAAAAGLLVFLLAERLVDGPPRHRPRDVAREAGIPLEVLEAMRRAPGLPGPDPDAPALPALDREGRAGAHGPRRRRGPDRRPLPPRRRQRRADAPRDPRARPGDGAGRRDA